MSDKGIQKCISEACFFPKKSLKFYISAKIHDTMIKQVPTNLEFHEL